MKLTLTLWLLCLGLLCKLRDARRILVRSSLSTSEPKEDDKPAAESCQYAGIKGKRPKNKELVSVCLNGPNVDPKLHKKCVKKAKSNYSSSIFYSDGKVVSVAKDELTMADCEELCTKNLNCVPGKRCARIPELKGGCKGYVVRDPFTSAAQSKPMCWLIPNDVTMSGTYPDEIKFDKLTIHEYGKTTPKKAFVKEQCDCGNRYIHVKRAPLRTRLEHLRVMLKNLQGATERNETEISNIESQAEALGDELKQFEDMAALGGVYDYLPVYIPHRIEKGHASYLPHFLLKATSSTSSQITGQNKTFSYYWEGPVRITNIYKKLDFSAIMYKCMDKKAVAPNEHWYIARRENLIAEAKDILRDGGVELEGDSLPGMEDLGALLMLFFRMRCFGHKIGDDGTIYERDSPVKTPYKVNTDFIGFGKGEFSSADNKGCFKNALKAAKKEEENVVKDVLMSDLEGDGGPEEPMKLLENDICSRLLIGEDNSLIKNLNTAEKILEYQGTLNAAFAVGGFATDVYDGVGGALVGAKNWVGDWWYGKETTTTITTTEAKVGEVTRKELLSRTKELADAMKQIVLRIAGIEGAEDEQLKAFCAKEMLTLVQDAGGIWPKISQNLAVRPDLVPDDYARNKLKETQSGNKDQGRDETLKYLGELDIKVKFPDKDEMVPITDFLEYDRFLSAGSVGQVDLWSLRDDTPKARAMANRFKSSVLPTDWHGTTSKVIVKTVFKTTESLYTRDWKLMEIFFTKLGKYMPGKISSIWDVLKNLENSIFDEFDLRKEARFTQRGRAMLKDFTKELKASKGPDAVTVTTPVGLETDSKYVMIQTLAPGKPLSDYLEAVKGQWDRLAEWRTHIYSTILNVFGYSAVQNGFFQADPHPGNWFWDSDKRALTLIDWGGVEDWTEQDDMKQAHCTLARLYSSIGHMTPIWESCDSVIFESSGKGALVSGTYNRHGVSIHQASEGEDELLMGHTYALTYRHTSQPYTLWYDGTTWVISEINLFHPDVTINKAKMVQDKAEKVIDQSFFGLALGKKSKDLLKGRDEFVMKWQRVDDKGKPTDEFDVKVSSGRTGTCDANADRTQAYQMAAQNLGIMLKSDCERLMYIDTREKRLARELNTDDIAFVCIHKDDSGALKGRVGTPPRSRDIRVDGDKVYIKIRMPVEKERRSLESAEVENDGANDILDLEVVEYPLQTELQLGREAIKQAEDRIFRPVIHESAALDENGVGSTIDWEKEPLAREDAGEKTEVLAYDQGQRAYAVAASLFDSDVAELAIMALQGRQSLSVFQPGEVPEKYTLFARCAIVFHGMVMDVMRENFMRLVPINKLQWLMQPHGDRFYKVWVQFADNYLSDADTTCAAGNWPAINKVKAK